MDFVQSPYFTDKNVEKEKGIICEEIKMYEDMPDNIIFERVMYNLFKYHPLKYPISVIKNSFPVCIIRIVSPRTAFPSITRT